jgi:DivIVA domain-containing protein
MARKKRKRQAEEATFGEGQPDAAERSRLTPVDVQQKVFRLAFRGYNEGDVDQFLDDITETLAALHEENKRLREQLQEGGGAPAGAAAAAQRQAEAIIRQAREEAARIAGGAESGRDAMGGLAAPAPAPASFLVRERSFLQQIASLVQDHARSLKDEGRRLREAPGAAAGSGAIGAVAGGVAAGAAVGIGPEGDDESLTQGSEPTEDAAAEAPGAPAEEPVQADEAEETAPARAASEGQEGTYPEASTIAGTDDVPQPEEATAPWRPSEQQTPEDPGWPGSSPNDPLVSAWESAFASGSEGGASEEGREPDEAPGDSEGSGEHDKKEEPSLRELFWGEE